MLDIEMEHFNNDVCMTIKHINPYILRRSQIASSFTCLGLPFFYEVVLITLHRILGRVLSLWEEGRARN